MPSGHLIEDLSFEVGFDAEGQAFDHQERLTAFAQGPALRIIEEVFDEEDAGGEVLLLEHLQVDLGTVSADDMEGQWTGRLRERLLLALNGRRAPNLAASVGGPTRAAAPQTRRQTQREALLFFLRHGRLPWHAARAEDGEAVTEWAWELLRDDGAGLVHALRAIGDRQRVARRLVRQFPSAWLDALLREILRSPSGRCVTTLPVPPHTASNEDVLVTTLCDALAAGEGYTGTLVWVPGAGDAARAASELQSRASLRARWEAMLRGAIASPPAHGSAADLTRAWMALAGDDRTWLRASLLRLGRSVRLRRAIVAAFTESMLMDLVGLWWGDAHRQVVAATLRDAISRFDLHDTSRAKLRRLHWELTLDYLLVGGGAEQFSEGDYGDSLRRGLAMPASSAEDIRIPLPREDTDVSLSEDTLHPPASGGAERLSDGHYLLSPRRESEMPVESGDEVHGAQPRDDTESSAFAIGVAGDLPPNRSMTNDAGRFVDGDYRLASRRGRMVVINSGNEVRDAWPRGGIDPSGSAVGAAADTPLHRSSLPLIAVSAARERAAAPTIPDADLVGDIDAVLQELAQLDAASARDALRRLGRTPVQRWHLADAMTEPVLTLWLSAWMPAKDAALVASLVTEPSLASLSLRGQAAPDARWLRAWCIDQLVATSAPQLDADALIGHLLRDVGLQLRCSPIELIDRLLERPLPHEATKQMLQRLRRNAAMAAECAPPPAPLALPRLSVLRVRLAAALAGASHAGLEETWRLLVREDPAGLRDTLRTLCATASVRRRVAAQFSDAMRVQCASLWLPHGDALCIAAVVKSLACEAWLQRGHAASVQARSRAARVQAEVDGWEFVLLLLLWQLDSPVDARRCIIGLLQQAAARDEVPIDTVARSVAASWSAKQRDAWKWAWHLFDELADEASPSRLNTAWPEADPLTEERIATQRQQFRSALKGGSHTEVHALWQAVLNADRAWLCGTIAIEGAASSTLRQRMAREWPDAMLREVVGLFAPSDEAFIASVADGGVPQVHAEESASAGRVQSDVSRTLLWEFTLHHLWVERPWRFERRPYGRSLLLQLARRAAQAPMDFVRGVADALPHDAALPAAWSEWVRSWLAAPLDEPPAASGDSDHPVLAYLQELDAPPAQPAEDLRHALLRLAGKPTHPLRLAVAHALEVPRAAERLLNLLPPDEFARVFGWLRPDIQATVSQCLAMVIDACVTAGIERSPASLARPAWRVVLREFFEDGRPLDLGGLARRLVDELEPAIRPADPPGWREALAAELVCIAQCSSVADSPRLSQQPAAAYPEKTDPVDEPPDTEVNGKASPGIDADAERATLAFTLADALRADLRAAMATAARPYDSAMAPSDPIAPPGNDPADGAIFIGNAGLALAGPYLPRLFAMLGLTDARAFKDDAAAQRGVLLLQFVATGSVETPETLLVLNKLMCGLSIATPVPRDFVPTDLERDAVRGMLQAMIDHWKIIGQTSIAGMRESFLQREGRLEQQEEAWHLRVEPRSFDMLLDQLPWGYATLKYPWMERVIHVDWR